LSKPSKAYITVDIATLYCEKRLLAAEASQRDAFPHKPKPYFTPAPQHPTTATN